MTYSTDKNFAANTVTITSRRAFEVINMNKKGYRPRSLQPDENEPGSTKEYSDILDESLSRFDHLKRKKNKKLRPNVNNHSIHNSNQ
jgi:hypothetical protein